MRWEFVLGGRNLEPFYQKYFVNCNKGKQTMHTHSVQDLPFLRGLFILSMLNEFGWKLFRVA